MLQKSFFQTEYIIWEGFIMREEFVICRRCGREIPKTMYCIYCGTALSEEMESIKRDSIKPSTTPEVPDSFLHAHAKLLEAQVETSSEDAELDLETINLLNELRKYQTWKVKLCGLLNEGRVSEEVFTKVYEEYTNEFRKFNSLREEQMSVINVDYEEKNTLLESLKREHEELRIRVAVGQIPESELFIKTPELAEKINSLTLETNKLKARLSQLENFMAMISPREAFELDKMARGCIESLDSLVEKVKIDSELGDKISEDLESVIAMFDSVLSDKREREKELRDELETLEVRYKVGEITLSEFESMKRGILVRLEQIWA